MSDQPTELIEREPTIEDVKRGFRFRSSEFHYISLEHAELRHAIACGAGWALVIGERGGGGYEWVYVKCEGTTYIEPFRYVPCKQSEEEWLHSDCGYGGAASCLRDALIHIEGASCSKCGCCVLPEDVNIRCHQCR